MTNIEEINNTLIDIVERRMELSRLAYSDLHYDAMEEELHEVQDDFSIDYGEDFEKVFRPLHQKYCPDTPVLSPISYLAKRYIKTGAYDNGTPVYDVADYEQGLVFDSPAYGSASLVLLPNPVRIVLTAAQGPVKETVWTLANP